MKLRKRKTNRHEKVAYIEELEKHIFCVLGIQKNKFYMLLFKKNTFLATMLQRHKRSFDMTDMTVHISGRLIFSK